MGLKQPDAWLKLVLKTMSTAELKAEAQSASNTKDERRWMLEELKRREDTTLLARRGL